VVRRHTASLGIFAFTIHPGGECLTDFDDIMMTP
jgi:hypothetical protein